MQRNSDVVEGIITIVQESRFQLVDDGGVGHLFILDALALAEPDQLQRLARDQARLRVHAKPGHDVIGRVATAIAAV